MKLVSLNVGLPREYEWQGKTVSTGIFKAPVTGTIKLDTLNFNGDAQADLTVHGGIDKAVYAYPIEHYQYWRSQLPEVEFTCGIFGENLTISGLLETEVNIGDRFNLGSAELMVTQPRMPCYKLGLRFNRPDMVKRFLGSLLTGFYFRVLQTGDVKTGDELKLISRDKHRVTVADITKLYVNKERDLELLQRAIEVEALPASWRDYFRKQLKKGSN
ncbi:MOSC domain-containing protein [Myxosarcina sp. GI1(2024)]